jgi:heme-degrading monooxygenase HmoA
LITLFFELVPRAGMATRYFEMAAELKTALARNPGLVWIDRFESLGRPGTYLSHQVWRDEASLVKWRAQASHHAAQASGRRNILASYHLRVAEVVAARGPDAATPSLAATYNDPDLQPERFVVSVLSRGKPFGDAGGDAFRSVYDSMSFAWVAAPGSRAEGLHLIDEAASFAEVRAATLSLISRDYGMHDRAEAPQYFPPVNV